MDRFRARPVRGAPIPCAPVPWAPRPGPWGRIRVVAVALAAVMGLIALATPASARDVFDYPWRTSSNLVVVNAHMDPGWRIPRVVRAWNRAPHVRVIRGSCARHRRAHCVRIRPGDGEYGGSRLWGATWGAAGGEVALIRLAARYGRSAKVTCHELGHALGLHHHGRRGCVADRSVTAARPSRYELRVVGRGYARN